MKDVLKPLDFWVASRCRSRGICYFSLLTSTALEVVCLEQEKNTNRGARQSMSLLMFL